MRLTLARSTEVDGLYLDGILVKLAAVIDIDDILLSAGKGPYTLKKIYLNDEWVRESGYTLPIFEIDLVELDS